MRFSPTRFTVASRRTGTSYRIEVAPPEASAAGAWPVVFVLDADDHFAAGLDAYRGLWARGGGQPLLLVGVGYGASMLQPGNRRIRDLTPTQLMTEPESGGAEGFHRFLVEELWPALRSRYPVVETGKAVLGHSLGALFALHALFRDRPFFTRAVVSAPSLGWDDRVVLRELARFRQTNSELWAQLFLCIGTADTESMLADFEELEQQLRKAPFQGLRVTSQRIPGRTHDDAFPLAYVAGLRALYQAPVGS